MGPHSSLWLASLLALALCSAARAKGSPEQDREWALGSGQRRRGAGRRGGAKRHTCA